MFMKLREGGRKGGRGGGREGGREKIPSIHVSHNEKHHALPDG
jgi:hypothetical protein